MPENNLLLSVMILWVDWTWLGDSHWGGVSQDILIRVCLGLILFQNSAGLGVQDGAHIG